MPDGAAYDAPYTPRPADRAVVSAQLERFQQRLDRIKETKETAKRLNDFPVRLGEATDFWVTEDEPEPERGFGGLREAEMKIREAEEGKEEQSIESARKSFGDAWNNLNSNWNDLQRFVNETQELAERAPGSTPIRERAQIAQSVGRQMARQYKSLQEYRAKIDEAERTQKAFSSLAMLLSNQRAMRGTALQKGFGDDAKRMLESMRGVFTEDELRRVTAGGIGRVVPASMSPVDLEKLLEDPEALKKALDWSRDHADELREAAERLEVEAMSPDPTFLGVVAETLRVPVLSTIGAGTGIAELAGMDVKGKYSESVFKGMNVLERGEKALNILGEDAALRGWSPDQLLMKIPVWAPGPQQPVRIMSEALNSWFDAGIGEGGKTSEFLTEFAFELAVDPLWAVGGVNKIAMASRWGATAGRRGIMGNVAIRAANEALAKPSAAIGRLGRAALKKNAMLGKALLLPEKTWKWMAEGPKAAAVVGDDGLEAAYRMEKAFHEEAGQDLLAAAQDYRLAESEVFTKFNLTPEQRAVAKNVVFEAAEHTTPQARRAAIARRTTAEIIPELTERSAVRHAAAEAVELYGDFAAKQLVLEGKFGLAGKVLQDDVLNYVMRQNSDELVAWIRQQPTARHILTGSEGRLSGRRFKAAWESFEKERKFREMPVAEVEREIRKAFKDGGNPIPENIPIFKRDPFEQLAKRAERGAEIATRRHLWASMGTIFGKDGGDRATMEILVARAANRKLASAVNGKVAADADAAEWARVLDELVEARGAVRGAARQADRLAGEAGLAGARAQEVRTVTGEAQAGSRSAYQLGRDAENKAVQVAEALKGEAEDLVRATPGASEARAQLKDARRLLRAAKDQKGLQEAAAAMARVVGAERVLDASDDVVEAAQELVKFAQQHIRNNPAIKDADQALRAANQMLADARQVAARVETRELAGHLEDLAKSANAATKLKGTGGRFLTHALRKEIEKAKGVADEVADYYAKKGEIADLAAMNAEQKAMGQGADIGDELTALRKAVKNAKYKSVRDVRAAMSKMRAELRKDAPAALAREFDRIWRRASDLADKIEKAQVAVSRPVVGAVRTRARQAGKKADEAGERLELADVNSWPVEKKLKFVDAVIKRSIKDGTLPPPPTQHTSALRIMADNQVALPDDIPSLTKLAATYVGPKDARKFKNYMEQFHELNSLSKSSSEMGRRMDAAIEISAGIKTAFQKMFLTVFPGAAVDMVQTTLVHGMFLGGLTPTDYARARKAMGGNMKTWAKGPAARSADGWAADGEMLYMINNGLLMGLNRAMSEGTAFAAKEAGPAMGVVEKTGRSIRDRGVLGAATRGLTGSDRAARAVTATVGAPLVGRVYAEELSRTAMFLNRRAKGFSRQEAAEAVIEHFGKVNEFGKLERGISSVLFFWLWRKNSIPITLRALLDKPLRSRLIATALAGDQDDPSLPEWARRAGGPRLGLSDNGNIEMLGITNSTWFGPTASLMESDFLSAVKRADVGAALMEGGKELLRGLPPHLKAAAQEIGDYDFFADRSWYDDLGDQTTRAPMGFWQFMESERDPDRKGEPGAIEKFFNLKAEYDRDNPDELKRITMDPHKKNLLETMGALGPLMTWASSFLDPRQADVADGVSLKKGLSRTFGFPIVNVVPEDIEMNQVRELRAALRKDTQKVGSGVRMNQFGHVEPDENQARGRQMARQMEMAESRLKEAGVPRGTALWHQKLEQEMLHTGYYREYMLVEMGRRLRLMSDLAKGEPALRRRDVPKPKSFESRFRRQREKEKKRAFSWRR